MKIQTKNLDVRYETDLGRNGADIMLLVVRFILSRKDLGKNSINLFMV